MPRSQCPVLKKVMLISGEAGIGKSRLVAALSESLALGSHRRVRYQCSPYHTNSALHPFIAQLERAAGIRSQDTPGQKLDKLEAMLALGTQQVASATPLIAALLSIPTGERYPPLGLNPVQQRRQTFATLLDQLFEDEEAYQRALDVALCMPARECRHERSPEPSASPTEVLCEGVWDRICSGCTHPSSFVS